MKKRILSLAMVLALVAVLVMPMAALAISLPAITVVPDTAGVANADYTIVFNVANGLAATNTVIVIFPAGTGLAAVPTGTINTKTIEIASGNSGTGTIIITVPSGFESIASAGPVTVVLTTGITNPAAGTNKRIWVATALSGGVALEGGVESAPYTITGVTTTTTAVSATMPAGVLTLTVPSAVTLTNLYGSGDEVSTPSVGTVLSTIDSGYTLYLQSNQAEGKLMLNGSGTPLLAALKIRPTFPGTVLLATGTGAAVAVDPAAVWAVDAVATESPKIVGATAGPGSDTTGTNTITLTVAQPKQTTGAAGTYSYILTWTLSAN